MWRQAAARRALAVTSSHFCSAERQFRLPLEYGGQRTPTAQWTATASGAVIVSREPPSGVERAVVVREATFGRMRDLGIKDAANMGAAMAPAAWETLLDYFTDTASTPSDFDLILTGDLGAVGSDLLRELALRDGFDIAAVHNDGGLMLYDRQRQDVHAGGLGLRLFGRCAVLGGARRSSGGTHAGCPVCRHGGADVSHHQPAGGKVFQVWRI